MGTKAATRTKVDDGRGELRSERIHARLTPSTKALVQEAAALAGRPVSDFLVDAALEKALATVQAHRVWRLTAEQSVAFAEAILDPLPPTPAMVARYQRYLEQGGRPFVLGEEPSTAAGTAEP